MRRKAKRVLLLLLTLLVCLSAVTAHAATFEKDGIEVTLTTDKSKYEENEEIDVTLTITNSNDEDISPVTVQYTIPEMCRIDTNQGSHTEHFDVIKSGETKVVKTTLKVMSETQIDGLPSTGDSSNIFLWLLLAGASIFAISRMSLRSIKRLSALVLCVCLMTSMLPGAVSTALAEEVAVKLNAVKDHTIEVPLLIEDVIDEEAFEGELAEEAEKSASADFEEPKAFDGVTVLSFEDDVKRSKEAGINSNMQQEPKKADVNAEPDDLDAAVSGEMDISKSIIVMGSEEDVKISISYGKGSIMQTAATYKSISNDPLWYTKTSSTKEKYSQTIASGIILPQSSHNYKNYTDEVYRLKGGSGCFGVTLHFDDSTYFESGWDGLLIYAGNEEYITRYTGSSLAGQSLTFSISNLDTSINGVILRLATDVSNRYYGFKVTKAIAHKMPKISTCEIVNNDGDVKLTWKKLTGYSGYSIERAEVTNGSVGTYYTIAEYSSSKATSFTDTSTVRGKTYAYRMRQIYNGYDGYYYRGPIYSHPYTISIPGTLPAPKNVYVNSSSSSRVQVSWDDVAGASGYAIYSSRNYDSGYKRITRVSASKDYASIDAPRTSGLSYYYVRPYIKADGFYFYGQTSAVEPNYALSVPSEVTGKKLTADSFRISWKKVANAQLYILYASNQKSSGYEPLYNVNDELITTTGTSIDLTGLSGLTDDMYFRVSAARVDGDCVSQSLLSSYARYAKTKYRALLIGNTYPGEGSMELDGPDNDVAAVNKMLQRQTGTPYAVTTKYNITDSGMKSAIASAFAGADSNDISLFYYSGHGAYSSSSSYLGALCGTYDTYLTVNELRTELDKIPGKKIVLLDSCHSGNHIGKSAGAVENEVEAFNDAVISAFAAKDKANLASSDYYVITACGKSQTSKTVSHDGNYWYGLFTQGLTKGSGYDTRYRTNCSWYADANSNGAVTLSEAYNYIKQVVSESGLVQSTKYYGPTSTVLWSR